MQPEETPAQAGPDQPLIGEALDAIVRDWALRSADEASDDEVRE